jgi:pilus assembly protein CpaC
MKTPRLRALSLATFLCSLLVGVCGGPAAARADEVSVAKGSSTRIAVPEGVRSINVSNPAVVDARPGDDGRSVLVNGLTEGNSELRIARLQGGELVANVTVHADLSGAFDQVKSLLSDVEGLTITVVGDKIVLKGNILTKSDYDEVSKVVEAYPKVILNMSTFDRTEMNKYVEAAILKDIGLDTITARVMGDTVILQGIVYSQADADRAVELAKLRMPVVKSLLKVQDVMIETDVMFVEVTGDVNKNIGSNILNSLGVAMNASGQGGTGAGGFPVKFGASASAAAQIQAIVGNGDGKIAAQPHISTKSGEAGTFQSGGTKYFSVAGNVGGSLQSVDYGVILKVKPTLQGRDRILNEVTVEVSMPVPDPSGVLTLQKYSTDCTSLCKVGESMVLSGMVQQMSSSSNSKTPILGDVPLLNLFFSNKTADRSQNEFVIVVTPRPVFPTESGEKSFSDDRQHLLQGKD